MITYTYDELEIQPLYTAQSWPSATDPSGFPGPPPYTRGVRPLGHSLDGWDVRQEVLKPTPAEDHYDSLRAEKIPEMSEFSPISRICFTSLYYMRARNLMLPNRSPISDRGPSVTRNRKG